MAELMERCGSDEKCELVAFMRVLEDDRQLDGRVEIDDACGSVVLFQIVAKAKP